ncbi:hypothetical protein [Agrobacterium tomkonis]|uniref:hypothetical protein n=1 Tax=Agrobacterium tomkonis TaxID=1183410 RepID=UPI001CD84A7A|nr:hypothetical protein [Agrobacterium tumefaciens]MCA1894480.1 hypothetical protein [Agrobacterium tomkonis]
MPTSIVILKNDCGDDRADVFPLVVQAKACLAGNAICHENMRDVMCVQTFRKIKELAHVELNVQ